VRCITPVDSNATSLLEEVARGLRPALLRARVPPPTVAFGRIDTLAPGYAAAVTAARRHGFEPVVRAAGGRAVAYHEGCLVVEEFAREPRPADALQDRFRDRGERLARALRSLGVDAHVGEVPGECCRGRHSVNARHAVKLAGTAQRVVPGGWLFGTVLTIDGAAALGSVLEEVYAHLGLAMDPRTVGSVADELPGCTTEEVRGAVSAAFADP
jgi:lipoate-protein ligase A